MITYHEEMCRYYITCTLSWRNDNADIILHIPDVISIGDRSASRSDNGVALSVTRYLLSSFPSLM